MKTLKTLVKDIYRVLEDGILTSPEVTKAFGERLAELISKRIGISEEVPRLRISNLGTKCNRKLWYTVRTPELAEKLPGHVKMKFLFGDIIEQLVLFLAEVSGHDVSGQQLERNLHGVKGHQDAIIDGVLVDVKSASSFSFRKFFSGLKAEDDSFGYLEQLGGYREASRSDKVDTGGNKAAFVVVDKTLGHILIDEHGDDLNRDYEKLVKDKQVAIESDVPPNRGFSDQPDGKSGNRSLGTYCGYCDFKRVCWPNLRVFAYANGPKYLTEIVRMPDVPEISC